MGVPYCAVVILVLSLGRGQATDQCSGSSVTNLKLSVTSRRNQTGHWLVKSELFNTAPSQQGSADREVLWETEHGTTVCAEEQSVHLANTIALPGAVSPEFELFPGLGYYKFHTTALTWDEGRATCVREGAHLLVINSLAETVVVKEFFARNLKMVNATHTNAIHLGVHDRYEEGQWMTVVGQSLGNAGYTTWHPGQPNGKATENCVYVHKEAVYCDGPCSWKLCFICERR